MEDGRNILYISLATKNARKFIFLVILFLVILLNGCSSSINSIDFTNFTQLASIKDLDFSKVSPNRNYSYWELRQAENNKATLVLGSGGTKTKEQLTEAERNVLNTTSTETGFNIGCQRQDGSFCFKYIVTIDNSGVQVLNTTVAVGSFLSSIDSVTEAALLASAYGYTWDESAIETGSVIQRRNGDYEMVVLRLMNLCLPVQTYRFHITVTKDTTLNVLSSENWQSFPDTCIQQN